jgi:hypothetical protein
VANMALLSHIAFLVEDDNIVHGIVSNLFVNKWVRANVAAIAKHNLALVDDSWVHVDENHHTAKDNEGSVNPISLSRLDLATEAQAYQTTQVYQIQCAAQCAFNVRTLTCLSLGKKRSGGGSTQKYKAYVQIK